MAGGYPTCHHIPAQLCVCMYLCKCTRISNQPKASQPRLSACVCIHPGTTTKAAGLHRNIDLCTTHTHIWTLRNECVCVFCLCVRDVATFRVLRSTYADHDLAQFVSGLGRDGKVFRNIAVIIVIHGTLFCWFVFVNFCHKYLTAEKFASLFSAKFYSGRKG